MQVISCFSFGLWGSMKGSQWHRRYISAIGNIAAFVNLKINVKLKLQMGMFILL
jgi:hypothetical protein